MYEHLGKLLCSTPPLLGSWSSVLGRAEDGFFHRAWHVCGRPHRARWRKEGWVCWSPFKTSAQPCLTRSSRAHVRQVTQTAGAASPRKLHSAAFITTMTLAHPAPIHLGWLPTKVLDDMPTSPRPLLQRILHGFTIHVWRRLQTELDWGSPWAWGKTLTPCHGKVDGVKPVGPPEPYDSQPQYRV